MKKERIQFLTEKPFQKTRRHNSYRCKKMSKEMNHIQMEGNSFFKHGNSMRTQDQNVAMSIKHFCLNYCFHLKCCPNLLRISTQ